MSPISVHCLVIRTRKCPKTGEKSKHKGAHLWVVAQRSPLRENRRQTAKETSKEVEPALNTS